MSSHIEDYALIGDCEAAALVARNGSLDWLCWPRFDSDACFAALLGSDDHGHWLIAPRDDGATSTRRYRPNTLILETRFECSEGAVTLVDFMPMRGTHSSVVRLVVGERGRVTMSTKLVLRFGYGSIVPWVTRPDDGTLRAVAGPDMVVLRTPVHLAGENMTTVGKFTVVAGQTVPFVLTYMPSHLSPPPPLDPPSALEATEDFWTAWSKKCRPPGHCSDAVMRSLITLKALTYWPTGGIVAAPTTSLPECLGGVRNWDYRFCWLRDATLTLIALMDAGFYEEAQSWRDWLLRAVGGSPGQIQIMYGVARERRVTAEGNGAAMVAGPPRLRAGARRQCCAWPAPARYIRRGDGCAPSGEMQGARRERIRLGAAAGVSVPPRAHLDPAGRWHMGNARRAPALHPFQAHS